MRKYFLYFPQIFLLLIGSIGLYLSSTSSTSKWVGGLFGMYTEEHYNNRRIKLLIKDDFPIKNSTISLPLSLMLNRKQQEEQWAKSVNVIQTEQKLSEFKAFPQWSDKLNILKIVKQIPFYRGVNIVGIQLFEKNFQFEKMNISWNKIYEAKFSK